MRYKKFIIQGYKGISDATEINISQESLIPIIGKNESGKTTCLEAIHAFDFTNDDENGGKHLINVGNLYSTSKPPVTVAAEIEVNSSFNFEDVFKETFDNIKKEFLAKYPAGTFDVMTLALDKNEFSNLDAVRAYKTLLSTISANQSLLIVRDLRARRYQIPLIEGLLADSLMNSLCEVFVQALPYILYFDDFRDRIGEKVTITKDEKSNAYSRWILYIDELFKRTKAGYSVFELTAEQDSMRRSIITEVQKYLNSVLIEEWAKYQFERNESIEIRIEYADGADGPYLHFKIVEHVLIDRVKQERFFDISDRSKGFYWYFNFMIKLHFNPSKRDSNDTDTIYLLDEPGSYLHTYALHKLVEQLKRLSKTNKVIYCTHSHNLLSPEYVPINSIRVAEKIEVGKITLNRIDAIKLVRAQKNSAYQPVLDALEVQPPLFEYDFKRIVLVEGIYDFYSFKMFTQHDIAYFPCVSALSIINQIPYMIFLNKNYLALWDNDTEGRTQLEKAKDLFGDVEAQKFLTLEVINNSKNCKLDDYYQSDELKSFNADCNGAENYSFNRAVLSLYFAEKRAELIQKYFKATQKNFLAMEELLKTKLDAQQKPERH